MEKDNYAVIIAIKKDLSKCNFTAAYSSQLGFYAQEIIHRRVTCSKETAHSQGQKENV